MPIPTQTQASAPQIGALFDPELAQQGVAAVARADAPSMVDAASVASEVRMLGPTQEAESKSRRISVGEAIEGLGKLAVVLQLPKPRGRHANPSPVENLLVAAGGQVNDYAAASAKLGAPLLPFEAVDPTPQNSATDVSEATARIIDGVQLPAGVRYVGADTPETNQPAA